MKIFTEALLASFIAAAVSGCTALHSSYERPELTEYAFTHGGQPAGAEKGEINPDFWLAFNDPYLTALTEEALAARNDYRQAVLTARKALKEAEITDTNMIPTVDASLGSGASRPLRHGSHSSLYGKSGISVSYEADLFGRLSAERKAQALSAEAAVQDARAARLSIAGTVAKLYWSLLYYQDAIKLYRENLESSMARMKLMQLRYDSGKISELDLSESRVEVVTMLSQIRDNETKLRNTISAINVLRNRVPDTPVENRGTLEDVFLPEINPGLSGDVLRFRPDMAAQEARLRAALASKDKARLDMYPRLSLSLGVSAGGSTNIVDFFRNPAGSIAGMLAFPFLNYYQNSLRVDLAELSRDSAEVSFVYKYYNALSEVQQALNNAAWFRQQHEYERMQLDLRRKNEEMYQTRYANGKVSFKDLLEARVARRNTELAILSNKESMLNSLKDLAMTMGGF